MNPHAASRPGGIRASLWRARAAVELYRREQAALAWCRRHPDGVFPDPFHAAVWREACMGRPPVLPGLFTRLLARLAMLAGLR